MKDKIKLFCKAAFLMLALCTMIFVSACIDKGSKNTKIENAEEYSVYDVVAQRNAELINMEINSAYYDMPEEILIKILIDYGTDLTRSDIVLIYNQDRSYYNGISTGIAEIESLKPDKNSMPPAPKPLPIEKTIPDIPELPSGGGSSSDK